jgi:aspartate-semialdehyde dehydrogenase
VEFVEERPSVEQIREALAAFPGVRIVDDRETNTFPMPLDASGIEEVLVGRIRHDVGNPRAVQLFVSGDQLLKGAALNAVQIGEGLIARGLV